jgi:hypothetical protein
VNAARHSWHPIDLSTLEREPAVRPTIQQGLFYAGGRHMLSGEPESGKSWLALSACVEEIRAGNNVVWVDREADARSMVERLRCFGVTDEELRQFVYIAPYEPVTTRGVAETIVALLEQYEPTLVVFDAFAGLLDLHDLDENKGADIERGYRIAVEPWRARGAGTIVIDHVVKATDSRGRWATGSQRKLGAVDVHIGLSVIDPFGRGREGRAKLYVHKDRSGFLQRPRFGDFVMASDEDGDVTRCELVAAAEGEDWKPTSLMERVSHWLEQHGGPASRSAITTGVGGRKEYVLLAIDELIASGYVAENAGARGAKTCVSVRQFSVETTSSLNSGTGQRPDGENDPFPSPVPDLFPSERNRSEQVARSSARSPVPVSPPLGRERVRDARDPDGNETCRKCGGTMSGGAVWDGLCLGCASGEAE